MAALELSGGAPKAAAPAAVPSKKVEKVEEDDDDEEVDLFGSDSDSEDDAEKARVRDERLAAYHAKKAKKPALIAKTSVVLDIKPWDDETDMDAMLKNVKTIVKEGLLWGACKLLFFSTSCWIKFRKSAILGDPHTVGQKIKKGPGQKKNS